MTAQLVAPISRGLASPHTRRSGGTPSGKRIIQNVFEGQMTEKHLSPLGRLEIAAPLTRSMDEMRGRIPGCQAGTASWGQRLLDCVAGSCSFGCSMRRPLTAGGDHEEAVGRRIGRFRPRCDLTPPMTGYASAVAAAML